MKIKCERCGREIEVKRCEQSNEDWHFECQCKDKEKLEKFGHKK